MEIPEMTLQVLPVRLPRDLIDPGCRLWVQPQVASPESVDAHVVQERGEPRLPITTSCLTYPVQRTGRAPPALCPVRVLLARVPLGQTPSLPAVRCPSWGFVLAVRRYYGPVRLLATVHHGVTATGLSHATRRTVPLDSLEISRFSRMELPHMHGVFDRAGPEAALAIARRPVLPSVPVTTSAPRTVDFAAQCPGLRFPCQRFDSRPDTSGQLPSRAAPHDSGSKWVATPFLQ